MQPKHRGELIPFPKSILPGTRKTAPTHRRLFELLDGILPAHSVAPGPMSECELRFFALKPHIEDCGPLDTEAASTIEQHYFEEQYLAIVSWFVLRALHKVALWNALPIKRARLRKTVRGEIEQYAIEIKGPKSSVGRIDVSVAIDKTAYFALIPFCETGAYSKLRFALDSSLGERSQYTVTTHVDLLLAAGTEDVCPDAGVLHSAPQLLPFALVELELASLESAPFIMQDFQTIPILKNAIPLWREKKALRKPFSAVRIAREGVTPELTRAVRILSRRCELQRTLNGRH